MKSCSNFKILDCVKPQTKAGRGPGSPVGNGKYSHRKKKKEKKSVVFFMFVS